MLGIGSICSEFVFVSSFFSHVLALFPHKCVLLCFQFSGWIQKAFSATDYSDITELAEEEEEKYYKHAVSIFSQKKSASSAGRYKYMIIVY